MQRHAGKMPEPQPGVRRARGRAQSRSLERHDGAIAIDFGTSCLRAAALRDGKLQVLNLSGGAVALPAAVSFERGERVAVGKDALVQRALDPSYTLLHTKRCLARACTAETLASWQARAACTLAQTSEHRLGVAIDGRVIGFEVAAKHLLEGVRRSAQAQLGVRVTHALVGVPAHFDLAQRDALVEAARGAGFGHVRLVGDAVAIAVGQGESKEPERIVLVISVGAGHTQAALVELRGREVSVLSCTGSARLGGAELDERISAELVRRLESALPEHGPLTAAQHARLLDASEQAKTTLSFEASCEVSLPHFTSLDEQPIELCAVLTRAELEALAATWLDDVTSLVEQALREAPVGLPHVDEVLLVGGMSRMPALHERIERVLGRKPSRRAHPEEALVRGLAWLANPVGGEPYTISESLVLPLRVARGPASIEVFAAGTTWPVKRAIDLHCAGEACVRVHLFQGAFERIDDCDYLGTLAVQGQGADCALRVELDADGRLRVSAKANATGLGVDCELRTEDVTQICRELSG